MSNSVFDSFNETTNEIGSFLEKNLTKSVNNVVLKIRTAVSKDKNRFVNDDFNLDLTYITNRIIAMGFPASDVLESNFRNSRADVKRFFDTYHRDKYLILNLTEHSYDASYFSNRVHHLGWMDHHSPSLGILLYSVQIIHQWLSQDPENVVAIHCAAGRGRTGTLICSYLVSTIMYEGKLQEVLNLFAQQRSSTGEGITVPSQIRYVDYISQLSTLKVDISLAQKPCVLSIRSLIMKPIPRFKAGWKPVIEVYNVNIPLQPVLLFTNRDSNVQNVKIYSQNDAAAMINIKDIIVSGDILIKVYDLNEIISTLLDKPCFRFAFHTSFISNYCLDLTKNELDESNSVLKNLEYPNDFSIRLMFGNVEAQPVQLQQSQPVHQQPVYVQPQQQPQPGYVPPQQQQQQQPQQQANYGQTAIDDDYSI